MEHIYGHKEEDQQREQEDDSTAPLPLATTKSHSLHIPPASPHLSPLTAKPNQTLKKKATPCTPNRKPTLAVVVVVEQAAYVSTEGPPASNLPAGLGPCAPVGRAVVLVELQELHAVANLHLMGEKIGRGGGEREGAASQNSEHATSPSCGSVVTCGVVFIIT